MRLADAALRLMPTTIASFGLAAPLMAQVQSTAIPTGQPFFQLAGATLDGDSVHLLVSSLPAWCGYIRSPDRGRTWMPPVPLGTSADAIASSGPRVYAFTQPTMSRSTDGGVTWQSQPHPTGSAVRAVHAAGLECHVLCSSNGTGTGGNVTYSRSLDGGATWSPPAALGSNAVVRPQLIVSGTTIHAFWASTVVSANGSYYQRSTDNGATWQPSPTMLGVGTALAQDRVAVSGAHVHVLRGSSPPEYLHSPDSGTTWLPPVTHASSVGFAASGSNVYIVSANASAVSVLRSIDDGATWTNYPIGQGLPLQLAVAATGPVVCVAWSEPSVVRRIATSSDAGATWQVAAGGNGFSMSQRGRPVLSLRPPVVSVVWPRTDYLLSAYVWFPLDLDVSADNGGTWHLRQTFGWGPAWLLEGLDTTGILWASQSLSSYVWLQALNYGTIYGYERFGPSKPGTGAIAPSLRLVGTPRPGNALTMTVADLVGGAPTLLAGSFAGEARTPLGSGVLLIAAPTLTHFGIASGLPGAPGAGTVPVPFTIPASPAMHQGRVAFQGFALDANAIDGFSSTSGLTMIVL